MSDNTPSDQSADKPPGRPASARERFLEALLESTTDYAIIATDLDGLITIWNEGARRILGWTEAEMLGQPLGTFFTPEDRAKGIPQAETKAAADRGRGNDERWHQRKDGSRFWASGEVMPLKDETGALEGYIKILRDRTEVRRAAEVQRSDAEFMHSILASSSDCITVLDLDAKLAFMNEGGQRIMGVSDLGAIFGQRWPDFWKNDGDAGAKAAVEAAKAGGTGQFLAIAETLGGTPRWWDTRVTPILGADGKPEKLLAVSRDVTATRRAEEEARRLATLAQQSQDFIGMSDPHGRVQFINRAGLDLVGLPDIESAQGKEIIDFFAPEDREKVSGTVLPAVDQQGVWEGELEFRHFVTGARLPVSYNIFALRDADNTLTGYGAVTRDLSEYRKATIRRAALVELDERLRSMTDIDEMVSVAAGIMGSVLGASRAGYGIMHADRETVTIERDWTAPGVASIVRAHHLRREYGSFIEDLWRGEAVIIPDIRDDPRTASHLAGMEAIDLRSLVNLPLIEHGELVALFFVHNRDPRVWSPSEVSFLWSIAARTRATIERRRAEHSLREAQGLNTLILNSSRDCIVLLDLDGLTQYVSPGGIEAMEITDIEEVIGQSWLRNWRDGDHDAARTAIAEARAGGTGRFQGFCPTHKGTPKWWDVVVSPVPGPDGRPERLVTAGRDITERKQAEAALADLAATLEQRIELRTAELARVEDALRHSQKMEAIGNLTGGIAHDFNNLLHVVGGNLQLLSKDIAGNDRAERRVQNAMAGVERGSKLAAQLLAFGRRQPLMPKVVNIGRFIRDMDDILRRALGEAIEVETIIAGGLWNTLVDPSNIENALLNLAINARDAMDGYGKLTIEAGNAFLDQAYATGHVDVAAGQYVLLAVTDTGSGMAPEIVEKVFEPFFTTKPEGKGTGLGLSMVYGFVKQSGGHVKIYSELGFGTTIKLYLPRSSQSEDTLIDIESGPVTGGNETVLVAEDDEAVRETVVAMLADLGYRVLKARDAQSALVIIESGIPIDLLFTDVVMPGTLKSTELARKAHERLPNLNVLFTSGYTENSIVHGGRLDANVELLSKPYTREALARKVRHVLANGALREMAAKRLAGQAEAEPAERPPQTAFTILICEDDELIRMSTGEVLLDLGHHVFEAADAKAALAILAERDIDILMTDVGLPDMPGTALADRAKMLLPRLKLIYATGHHQVEGVTPGPTVAIITKPYRATTLALVIEEIGKAR